MNTLLASLPRSVVASLLLGALSFACAAPSSSSDEATEHAVASELTQSLSDDALEAKLTGILKDVSFTSESDFPYVVIEGEKVTETQLTEAVIRRKLQKAVKESTSSNRDILPSRCRAATVDVEKTIADGDKAVVPADRDDDDFVYAFHDRQLGIALKVMRSQLRSVVGFTFGTNASGDEDDMGPVVYVYVGISKKSGKLIAILTEAVYT